MLIVEFRITMPMSVEEYKIAQLYCVAEFSKENSNSNEGIEVVKNEAFEDTPLLENNYESGQYTYKIYHLKSKFPAFLRFVLSNKLMSIHEEAWNAYPYCRTVLTHPSYESFKTTIETMHLADRGETENAHKLSPELMKMRKVVYIDIADDSAGNEYSLSEDPKQYHSIKTDRGPLTENWNNKVTPVMTCYKLVTVSCPLFFQSKVEMWIQEHEQKLFHQFHRKMFCLTDEWYGKTLEDIRQIEEKLKEDLQELLNRRQN